MASAFSHTVAALGLGACFYRPEIPRRIWALGVLCAVLPDIDVLGFLFGIPYGDPLGHRGFTHSLAFAAFLGGAIVLAGYRQGVPGLGPLRLWSYLFLATASHGLLDALTDGGLGVAFFAPFDNERYFLPIRPIKVSPIAPERFFSERGLAVIRSELLWVWLPSALLATLIRLVRRRLRSSARHPSRA